MYGSRSDHNKSRPKDDFCCGRRENTPKHVAIAEGLEEQIIVQIDMGERAALVKHVSYLHDEALFLNSLDSWERESILMFDRDFNDPDFWAAVDETSQELDREREREQEAAFDAGYGGYSDDYVDDADLHGHRPVDCWLPFMRLPELRDTFGENWLGNGFHIVQGNAKR